MMLNELVKKAELAKVGIGDPFEKHRKRPLALASAARAEPDGRIAEVVLGEDARGHGQRGGDEPERPPVG